MSRRAVVAALLTMAASLGVGATESAAQASPSCTISANSVAFGSYNVFDTPPVDSTGAIIYSCNSQAKNISISLSRGTSSTFTPRAMTNGAETLTYNLFLNAARTTIWGDGTGGTSTYTNSNPPNNADVNVTIYGRIPSAQDVSAGNYSDTILATINF